jgi:ribonucleoside-diphosphate reductase alpha chain
MAATHIEKSTVDINRWGIQPRWMKHASASSAIQVSREQLAQPDEPTICMLGDGCEACQ